MKLPNNKLMKLPDDVNYILTELDKNGHEGYIVGGCVRDYIMGIKPHDYDITTSALPHEVKQIFSHTIDTGIKHGTVTIMIDKIGYEITTYRIDGEYKDNRHPEQVIFTNKLIGDLARRDFTVNAIAYNNKNGYVDAFNGIKDIQSMIIRGVGDPNIRFQEDALRMMRAIRFSAQLNFSIEDNTLLAIKENAELIKNISSERIREEFFKLLMSRHNEKLSLLIQSGLAEYILPELLKTKADFENINLMSSDISIRLAYLFNNIEPAIIKAMLKRLHTDNKTITKVTKLIEYNKYKITDNYSIRKLISHIDILTPALIEVLAVINNKDMSQELTIYESLKNDCCKLEQINLNGKDLTRIGIKGKDIGNYLDMALDLVLHYPDKNKRSILINYIKENLPCQKH